MVRPACVAGRNGTPPGPLGFVDGVGTAPEGAPGAGSGGTPGLWISTKLMYFFQPAPWQLMFAQKL